MTRPPTENPRAPTLMVRPSLVSRLDLAGVDLVAWTNGREVRREIVGGRSYVVGSGEDADLRIEDATVSRAHARLTLESGFVRVTDLGSTNGTFFEGARIVDASVPLGGSLLLGRADVRLRPQASEVKAKRSAGQFGALVGDDPRMRELFGLLEDVAAADVTVIVEGETGTGKELVASAIHAASPRSRGPFVVFDCASIPRDLAESMLFGHAKGAFTGALAAREGAFRRAHGGTIFLDEIGELPADLQPKLLRVLESRTVQAVGEDRPHNVDVRVVCATHRDLRAETRAGRFRADLYYRLAVVRVELPPLRERPSDIPVLARRFLKDLLLRESAGKEGAQPRSVALDEAGLVRVAAHPFPGNVRELRNVIERAVSLSKGAGEKDHAPLDLSAFLSLRDDAEPALGATPHPAPEASQKAHATAELAATWQEALDGAQGYKAAKALVVDAFERAFLVRLMATAGASLSRAAIHAQMDRKHLREMLRKHGLRDGDDDAAT